MRKLKFRIWSPIYKEFWHKNFGQKFLLKDTDVVMQFTGLTDKNGKEIYEGDILMTGGSKKWLEPGGECCAYKQYKGIVSFNKKTASFYFSNNSKEKDFYWPPNRPKVIGNIYENPDLIKKSNGL
jgi:uncharacterized phage protein (TIGR01671 family)